MAIKTNYQSNTGVELTEAYIRINGVCYRKPIDSGAEFNYSIEVYKDQNAKEALAVPMDNCNYIFTGDLESNDNLIIQAYNNLKTIYPNSEDC